MRPGSLVPGPPLIRIRSWTSGGSMAGMREDAESGPAGLTLATSKVGDWANAIDARRNAACLMRSASTHYAPIFYNQFVPETNIVVAAATTTPKLQDGV